MKAAQFRDWISYYFFQFFRGSFEESPFFVCAYYNGGYIKFRMQLDHTLPVGFNIRPEFGDVESFKINK